MSDFHEKEKRLIVEYETMKPLLTEWGGFVDIYIIGLLKERGFDLARIQIKPRHRLKTDLSVIRRAFYRDIDDSTDPLRRIEDKVATRLVVTTLDDVKQIQEIIMEHKHFWTPRESRGLDKYLANPREFGYQSLHINLTPTSVINAFENASKKDRERYICELQVRTLLQHAFAEVAHDTIYKGAFGADSQLVRILSRGMALMETTDEHFCRAYEIMNSEKTYENSFLNGLISFSKERLGIEFPFKKVDGELTEDLFKVFDIKGIEMQEVERTLIANKDTVQKAINKTNSYLREQPVILLIMHMVFTNTYKLKEEWPLEEDILKDIFFKLGYSLRK